MNEHKGPNEAIAYVYCYRLETEEQKRNPQEIIRSFVRQLSRLSSEDGRIHETSQGLQTKLERDNSGLDAQTCQDLLLTLINSYQQTTITLDGLDKCQRASREQLCKTFDILMAGRRKLGIFVSSRPDGIGIQCYF